MTTKSEIVTDKEFGIRPVFKAYQENTVSWKAFGKGVRNFEASTHPENLCISFVMQECDLETKNRAMRQTMFNLNNADAQAFFDWMVSAGFKASA